MYVALKVEFEFGYLSSVVQPVQIVVSQYRTIAWMGPCTGPLIDLVLSHCMERTELHWVADTRYVEGILSHSRVRVPAAQSWCAAVEMIVSR